jgi:hypothetical protein
MHSRKHHKLIHPASFKPQDWLRFVHMRSFSRRWEDLGLSDEDLQILEVAIMAKPQGGVVIPGAGGLRKLRFAPPHGGRGKSRAYRVFYVYFPDYGGIVLLMGVVDKSEQSDISQEGKKALRKEIERFRELLDRREFL